MKKFVITILVVALFLTVPAPAQDPAQKAEDPPQAAAEQGPRIWRVPAYHMAHLQRLITEFNKLWEAELEKLKLDLKANYRGFETMPVKDTIYDQAKGYFIHREDYLTLQREAAAAAAAPIKKDPEKK